MSDIATVLQPGRQVANYRTVLFGRSRDCDRACAAAGRPRVAGLRRVSATVAGRIRNGCMITLVVPTRNRAYTLAKVLPSYFEQRGVSEIVIVDDAGDDRTEEVFRDAARRHPEIRSKYLRNSARVGASQARNIGVQHASNDYILFCDDDEYLEADYAGVCLGILQSTSAGAVSGRRVYMRDGETPQSAVARFGNGVRRTKPFDHSLCMLVNAAHFEGELLLPFTNAIILTRKDLLRTYPFDDYYARGNGFREETDYQMNLFVNGYDIIMTNQVHSIHLPLSFVRRGGQRAGVSAKIYWSIHYTNYFYDKYYERYAVRTGTRLPKSLAKLWFAAFITYWETVRPQLHRLATAYVFSKRARFRPGWLRQ
jgi:glycosyltransferase involved in cell wall biosynthesis